MYSVFFTGRTSLMSPNIQCESIEGLSKTNSLLNAWFSVLFTSQFWFASMLYYVFAILIVVASLLLALQAGSRFPSLVFRDATEPAKITICRMRILYISFVLNWNRKQNCKKDKKYCQWTNLNHFLLSEVTTIQQ